MLDHTFCHIPGIGLKTEKKLWEAGITAWDDWSESLPIRVSALTRQEGHRLLEQSRQALQDEDAQFFADALSSTEPWRLFPHFRNTTVYLDIETTGLGEGAEVTTIALYDGHEVFTYVNGQNLDDFIDDIFQYKVIVSYNGKSFDIPMLERFFKIRLNHAQIDLRHVLARLGFRGGLKGCEKQLGLHRGNLDGVDGYFAVVLWREYCRQGDPKILETLLAYNIEDTVNLERLAVEAYNRNIESTPFAGKLELVCPPPPPNPCFADYEYLNRIREDYIRNG